MKKFKAQTLVFTNPDEISAGIGAWFEYMETEGTPVNTIEDVQMITTAKADQKTVLMNSTQPQVTYFFNFIIIYT